MSNNYGGPRMGMSQMNGNRRPGNLPRMPPIVDKPVCIQHDDLIKYICESWNKVSQEADKNTGSSVLFYQEQENHHLKDFEPFDLDAYWRRREVQTVHQPQQS